ncbi:MAG TPA: hypothetical protein VFY48_09030 [Solirubrobacterales bacterium]|nr:hypothetical protein [Solirubrobacterales bacterium]
MRVALLTLVFFGSLVSSAAAAVPLEEGLDAVSSTVGEVPKVVPPPDLPVTRASGSGAASRSGSSDAQPPGPIADSVDHVVGGVETVAGPASRTLPRAEAPVPPASGERSGSVSQPEARVSADSMARPTDPGARSLRPAVRAPLRELLAHVWPAIALGPIGRTLIAQLAGLDQGSPVSRAGAAASPFSISYSARAGSPSSFPAPSAPDAAPPSGTPFFSPHGGGMSLLVTLITVLASLVGLVALARLTVGEDFFSTRWLR